MPTIENLQRKIALLDQYATALQKENSTKNRQTEILYTQINDVRKQNDILRHHLEIIRMANEQKTQQSLAFSVRNSVQVEKFLHQNHFSSKEQNSISCQTDYIQEVNHDQCTQQVSKLTRLIADKDNKIATITKEGQQMYEAIESLQEEVQRHCGKQNNYQDELNKLQSKIQNLQQENEYLQNQQNKMNHSLLKIKSQQNYQKHQFEQLIKQNNQLIQKIRYLQKQKNAYYHQLQHISPLKTNNLFLNQQKKIKTPNTSLFQTKKPGMFVSNKTKMKNERWKMIQSKIMQLKSENEQIKANLDFD